MSFSWKQAKKDAIATALRRAKTMAVKTNSNPDFAIRHPDWIREAQNNQFINMTKSITEEIKKQQERALLRKLKTHARRED